MEPGWEWPEERIDTVCRAWGEMYASGRWTLSELEQHVATMLPIMSATRETDESSVA